jgi:hypothetical protein
LDQFAYIYNLGAQAVPVETDISFDSNGINSNGIAHIPGASQIQINSGGIYHVTFSVLGVEANQFGLFVNGSPITGTIYGTANSNQENNGQTIINLNTGDILTLRNHTSGGIVTLQAAGGSQTGVNASILLEKISQSFAPQAHVLQPCPV